MTSANPGNNTLVAGVAQVSKQGFHLLLGDEELFVAFAHFPWFRDAPIAALADVRWPSLDHLHWPALDIDVSVASLRNPEQFPLVSRVSR